MPFQELPQPGKTLIIRLFDNLSLLVFPMGSDAFLCNLMHFICSNLDLDPFPIGPDDGGVEGLIHILFGKADIVLEFPWNGLPEGVDDAQHVIALLHGIDDDPESGDVIDLIKVNVLFFHF